MNELVEYAEFLRSGGNPHSPRGARLRGLAFQDGQSILLESMHAELVCFKPKPVVHGPVKAGRRRETPSERRRREAARVLNEKRPPSRTAA